MKRGIYFLILSAALASCNNADDIEAKKEKLKELRTEEASLGKEIRDLEKEIALAGGEFSARKLVPVDTSILQPGPFAHSIEVFGTVDSDNNIEVHPETSGPVEDIKVYKGAKVKKGQLLAVIDNSVISQSIKEVQTSLELANTLYEKQKRLWEQKVGTELQFIEAKNRKESLEKKLGTLNSQLAMSYVKAPISGVVDDVFLNEGEMASPAGPIFRVVNSAASKVEADISEAYLGKIKKGDVVKVEISSIQESVEGKVASVSEYINPANRTFKVTIDVGKYAKSLKPNMLTRISIYDYKTDKALVIPNNVIQYDQKGNFVFVVNKAGKDFKVVKKYIETDLASSDGTIIKSGVKPGDAVVVSGQRAVTDGEKVSIKTR